MKKEKILFVTSALSGGGAERVLVLLANAFAGKVWEVDIASLYKDDVIPYAVSEKVSIIRQESVDSTGVRRVVINIRFLHRILRKREYKCIIAFQLGINVQTLIAACGTRIPVFVSERCDPGNLQNQIEALYYQLSKLVYCTASGIVFQTEYVKKYYSKKITKKSVVIANPVSENLPKYQPDDIDKKIVAVGRLSEQKNHKLLISAFEIFHNTYSDYVLEIYGRGELQEELEQFIIGKKLSNCVFLKGFQKDISDKIKNATAFVLSSNYEGIPNAMLEAMAIGVPVICTDCPVGGVRSIINQNINGILVPMNDVNKLSMAITEVTENKLLNKKLRSAGQTVREKYSLDRIVDEWENFIFEKTYDLDRG